LPIPYYTYIIRASGATPVRRELYLVTMMEQDALVACWSA